MGDAMSDNVVMLNAADFMNLVQRHAVELARVLDAPGPNLKIEDVLAHVERMKSFCDKAKALADQMQKADAA